MATDEVRQAEKEIQQKEREAEAREKERAEEKAEKGKAGAKAAKKAEPAVKFDKKQLELTGKLHIYEVIQHPLVTEKAVNMIEAENKMVFVVNNAATRADVKKAVEALYGVKVDKVNIARDLKMRKRALVAINKSFKADEVATRLGVL